MYIIIGGLEIFTLDNLGIVADIIGILGFMLTILLLYRSNSLHKLIAQKYAYNKEREKSRQVIQAIRNGISDDGVFNERSVSQLRIILFSSNEKFSSLNKGRDKKHIKKTLKLLESPIDEIDKQQLCVELDYFIARYGRDEN